MTHELIGKKVDILDYGFVQLIDVMGDDSSIVQAARVSYQKGTKAVRSDQGLINYLMRNHHNTPFEMVEFKFNCKMPIFVARQWIRHRTANVNEMSARYSVLPEEFYTPETFRAQGTRSKQVAEGEVDSGVDQRLRYRYLVEAGIDYGIYEEALRSGVGRELARICLPVSIYTQWFWKIDLHNLFHFLQLRLDPHAQYEVRVYAEAMSDMVQDIVPMAWKAFDEYRLHAITLSKSEVERIKIWWSHDTKPPPSIDEEIEKIFNRITGTPHIPWDLPERKQ